MPTAAEKRAQNKTWKATVDRGYEVDIKANELPLLDEDWKVSYVSEPKSCPTAGRSRSEVRAIDADHGVLSKGRRAGDYLCTAYYTICVDETANPNGPGTRHDPPITVAGRAYSPSRPESRHTTALMPPRIGPAGIGIP